MKSCLETPGINSVLSLIKEVGGMFVDVDESSVYTIYSKPLLEETHP